MTRSLVPATSRTQNSILLVANKLPGGLWAKDGSISISALTRVLTQGVPDLRLKVDLIKASDLNDYVSLYPLIIVYKETMMGHINVIVSDGAELTIMDPWYPPPFVRGFLVEQSPDGPFYLYNPSADPSDGAASLFNCSGVVMKRRPKYYTDRPLTGGKVFVAYPTKI